MTTSPDMQTTMTHVRAVLVACIADITGVAAGDVRGYADVTQAGLPYITTRFSRIVPLKRGTSLWGFALDTSVLYHGWNATEGYAGEAEIAAQMMMVKLAVALQERPMLQSPAYVNGATGLAPTGISVADVSIVTTGEGGAEGLAVLVNLTIPIEVQLEEDYS